MSAAQVKPQETVRPRSSRLWRWTKRSAVVLLGLLIIARLIFPLVLPSVLERLGAKRGLDIQYQDLHLALLFGKIELEKLDLRPLDLRDEEEREEAPLLDPREALAHFEHLLLDLDVSALLLGNLVLHRVEADGVDLRVERDANGAWLHSQYLASGTDEEALDATEAADADVAQELIETALDFTSPVRIDALRVQHAQVHFTDLAGPTPFRAELEAFVRLSYLGSEERSARLEITVASPEVLDRLLIEADGFGRDRELEVNLSVRMNGLRPEPLAAYLAPIGLVPIAHEIDAALALTATAHAVQGSELETECRLSVDGIELVADENRALGVDSVLLYAPRVTTQALHAQELTLTGLSAAVRRLADGTPAAGGFAFRGGSQETAANEAVEDDGEAPGPGFRVVLDDIQLSNTGITFSDEAIVPATDLRLEEAALTISNVVIDPARRNEVVTLRGSAALPGALESFSFEGQAVPFAERRTARLGWNAEGITLASLEPYLTAAGLASTLDQGRFSGLLEFTMEPVDGGGSAVTAELKDLAVQTGDERTALLAIDRMAIGGLAVTEDRLAIAEIALEGPAISLRRDAAGSLHLLGLRTLTQEERSLAPVQPEITAAPGETPKTAPTNASPAATDRRIGIDRIVLDGTALTFVDEAGPERFELHLDDLGALFEELAIGGDPTVFEESSGKIHLWFRSPGLAERFELEGRITTRPGPLHLDAQLKLTGRELVTTAIDPFLGDLGIQSTLEAGRLDAGLDVAIRESTDGLRVRAKARELSWADGEREFASATELSVDELLIQPNAIRVGTVLVTRPQLSLAREADGAIVALGLRYLPPQDADPVAEKPTATTRVEGSTSEVTVSEESAPVFALEKLQLESAAIAWSDAFVSPNAATELRATGSIANVLLGEAGPPASMDLELGLAGSLDAFRVTGTADLAPTAQVVHLDLGGNGIRIGSLQGYLPPGMEVTLVDGRFAGSVDLESRPASEGGQLIEFELGNFDFRESESEESLFGLKALRLIANRLDPQAGIYDLEELVTEGLEFGITRTGPQRFEALGLSYEVPEGAPVEEAPLELATEAADSASGASANAPRSDAAPARPSVVGYSGLVETQLPTIRLGKVDFGITRAFFRDATTPSAQPLVGNLRLVQAEPAILLAPDLESLSPYRIAVEGGLSPFIERGTLTLEAAPFALDPYLVAELDVRGINGDELLAAVPDLREHFEAPELRNGSWSGRLDANLNLARTGPLAIDVSRGIGVQLQLTDIALRATEGGPVLAGLDRLFVDAPAVRFDGGTTRVDSVELTRPIANLRRTAEGLHVCGVLLKAAPEETASETEDEPVSSEKEEASQTTAAVQPAEGPPTLLVREILVDGIDFRMSDESVTPPFLFPLIDMDLEVKGLAIGGEPRPMRFRAFVESGKVPLPERQESAGLLRGFLGEAAEMISGGGEVTLEERSIWEELTVTGRIVPAAQPKGFVSVAVQGFELPAFQGPARESGVDIADGLIDHEATLRFLGERGLRVETKTTLSELNVTEPPGGPIASFLTLPAPLDTVLYVLRDQNEQQVLPIAFALAPEGLSVATIAKVAGQTLLKIITDALTSSPLRVAGGLTNALGIDLETEPEPLGPPLELEFIAGDANLQREDAEALLQLAEELRGRTDVRLVVQHAFGEKDIERSRALGSPSRESLLILCDRLRRTRDMLEHERAHAAAAVRSELIVGRRESAQRKADEVRILDERLMEKEVALDAVSRLLRPGADRRLDRRTRAASLILGEDRLKNVAALFERAGIAPGRVEVRRARFFAPETKAGGRVVLKQLPAR